MPIRSSDSRLSVWLIPLKYASAALLCGYTIPRLAHYLFPTLVSTISVNAAIGIFSSVASGMLALTGVVFSLSFVMVQFSATAYSPRLVVWIARDRVMSHAIGVFTATFLYALASLAWVDRQNSGRVPLAGIGVVEILLVASVVMFVALIQRMSMLHVTRMLIFTGNKGRETIETVYLSMEMPCSVSSFEDQRTVSVFHHGRPQIVQTIDIGALIDLAIRAQCWIEVAPAVGDAVFDSTPIAHIYGRKGDLLEKRVRDAIQLGNERTFEQDPKYAIRLLVDIAIKALSPAMNDPTTAVQALDQIEDLLIRLGRRRLEIGSFRDGQGQIRVLVAFPKWEDFLRLAFDEIRFYGATSVQVMRRMKALIIEMLSVMPEERRPALKYWEERLRSTVIHSFADSEDILNASSEDQQGLGSARRSIRTNR